ncbi:hypothetical protein [Mesorhizobium sp.]|uniref:hypothetical protein n=1 Tax=Mesorhizobium sp. TaxID=1871066 RepID=UPI0025EBCA3D|nr:hypothetical protein [Mesorhizobium sp.]
MPLQPHSGDAVNVGMCVPDLARVFFGQPAQIVRQAGSLEQKKIGTFTHDGFLW